MFHAGTLGYFGEYLALAQMASDSQKARHILPNSYGTIGYEPNVQRMFGLPRAISHGGVVVNVRLSWVIQALDGDTTKRRDLSLQTGMLSSALEHAVPEQLFKVPQQAGHGVSAVRALQLAAQQGQRIYHITPANQAQVFPNLHLDGLAINEIMQALATGKEVIAHTDRISVPGWTGEGYILFDPISGGGAYKITGGSNGGFFDGLKELFAESLDSLGLFLELIGMGIAGLAAEFSDMLLTLLKAWNNCSDFWAKWLSFYIVAFTVVGVLGGYAVVLAFGLFWGAIIGFLISYILVDMYIELVLERRCPA